MNTSRFLVNHGEKLGVAIVAAGVGYWIWSTASDPALLPGATPQKPKNIVERATVEADFQTIEKALSSQQGPTLRQPPNYLDQARTLLTQELPNRPRMGWLTAHPDIGPIIKHKPFFYVYELPPVTVSASDQIGAVQLTFEIPTTARTNDRESRVADALSIEWTRSESGTVVNRARRVALQVDIKAEEGPWRPLAGKGILAGGIVPLTQIPKGTLELQGLEPWAKHVLRARLVALATGFDPANHAQTRTSVLVHGGSFVNATHNGLAEIKRLMEQWPDAREPESEGRLLAPFLSATTGLVPEAIASLSPKPLESVFLGPQGHECQVNVTSETRFALKSAAITDAGSSAKILVTKRFTLPDAKTAWLEAPHLFNVGQGGSLGAIVSGATPISAGRTVEINLTTPFVVSQVRKKIDRVWYYEVVTRTKTAGGKGKDLAVVPKISPTEIVTLQNPQSGAQFDLIALDPIAKSSKAIKDRTGRIIVYPAIFEFEYNEIEVFSKNPSEFTTYGLVPPAPVTHKPDRGPLPTLLAKGVLTARTDTDYIEFPDGRLIWWYPLENIVEQWAPANFQFPKGPANVPLQGVPVPPASGVPANGNPPPAPPRTTPPSPSTKPAP